MSTSTNEAMIQQITNPPKRKKKMNLSDIFEKGKNKIRRLKKKLRKRPKRVKKKSKGY
jgi:hypothetical protein